VGEETPLFELFKKDDALFFKRRDKPERKIKRLTSEYFLMKSQFLFGMETDYLKRLNEMNAPLIKMRVWTGEIRKQIAYINFVDKYGVERQIFDLFVQEGSVKVEFSRQIAIVGYVSPDGTEQVDWQKMNDFMLSVWKKLPTIS